MTTTMYRAMASSMSRQEDDDYVEISHGDDEAEILCKPAEDRVATDEQSSAPEIDNVDGKEKKAGTNFISFIRDLVSAPNVKITHGKTVSEMPCKKVKEIRTEDVYCFEAPPGSLAKVHNIRLKRASEDHVNKTPVAGITNWKRRSDQCYAMVTSLYDKLRDSSGNVGDPIADCTAVLARPNNCILILADGVSWGDKSRMAARSAVYGSLTYLASSESLTEAQTTRDVFRAILRSFENAQKVITEEEATLTTLCVGVVVELQEKDKWCLCVVNVGDSLAFVYNQQTGVREATIGSHSIDQERDMRFSGGALGPADGYNPDLSNLTCAFTLLETGDIVYLTSDGISDNFDPVIGKFPMELKSSPSTKRAHEKPLTPRERHSGMLVKMRQLIEEGEGPNGLRKSAVDVCAKLLNFVLNNTDKRRRILEQSSLSEEERSQMTSKEFKERSLQIKEKADSTPGKLDHASIVAFQVGYLEPAPLVEIRRPSEDLIDGIYQAKTDEELWPEAAKILARQITVDPSEDSIEESKDQVDLDIFQVLIHETIL